MTDGGSPRVLGLAILAILAVICTLTGRLHVALAGPRRLATFGPFEAQVSAVLGTVWWMALLTTASTAGLSAPRSLLVGLAALAAALFAVLASRRHAVLRPARHSRAWIALLLPVVLAGITALLPVLRNGRFSTENDSLLYCSLAQWLQDHSFGQGASSAPGQPLAHYAAVYQGAGLPLASAFLLAGVRAGARAASPVVVYPAVSAWGLVLGLSSLLAFGRRVLHFPMSWLTLLGLGLAALLQPLAWAHHVGFFAQTFATPLLVTITLHLAQVLSPRRWRPEEAALGGLLVAGVASTYPPFLPLVGGCWAGWLVERMQHRSGRGGSLVRFIALAAIASSVMVLAQGVNVLGAFTFLSGHLFGGHVGLSPWGFLQAAVGAWFWTPFRLPAFAEYLRAGHLWLAPLYAWLTIRGLRNLARDSRSGPLLGCLTVLAAALAWYGLIARDPWTGRRGHTWNLFKLTLWAYVPIVLAQMQGLLSLRPHRPVRWLAPALVSVPITLGPMYWCFCGQLGADLEAFVGLRQPLQAWGALRQQFLLLSGVRLLAADAPSSSTPFLPTYLGLLTYPRPIAGDWKGALWVPPDPRNEAGRLWSLLERGERFDGPERIAPVVTGLGGFVTDRVVRLGGGVGLVQHPTAPQVLAVLHPSDASPGPAGCVWLGRARTGILVFSPQETRATLRLIASPGRDMAGRTQRLVMVSQGESQEVLVKGYPEIDLPLRLGQGASRVEVLFPEVIATARDRRRLCVLSMVVRAEKARPRAESRR